MNVFETFLVQIVGFLVLILINGACSARFILHKPIPITPSLVASLPTTTFAPLPTSIPDLLTTTILASSKFEFSTVEPISSISPCGSQWTYFDYNNQCYILMVADENINWHEAEDQCGDLGGHLASIHDEVENMFLAEWTRTGLLYKNSDRCNRTRTASPYFPMFGLMFINDTSEFRYSDQSTVNFFPDQQIFDTKNERFSCATSVGENKYYLLNGRIVPSKETPLYSWVFESCNEASRKRFVCQKSVGDEIKNCEREKTLLCGRKLICPSMWTYLEETQSCYQVTVIHRKGYEATYDHAYNHCKEQAARLVIVSSEAEYEFLLNFTKIGTPLQHYSDNFVWIGGVIKPNFLPALIGRTDIPVNPNDKNSSNSSRCLALYSDGNQRNLEYDIGEMWKWKNCDTYMRMYVCEKQTTNPDFYMNRK